MNSRSLSAPLAALAVLTACSGGTQPAAHASGTPIPASTAVPAAPPSAAPTPQLPAYYIESLRARAYPGGKLELRQEMFRGAGFTKYHMAWPRGGQTLT